MLNKYKTPKDIYILLERQNAPKRLIRHHQLVVEATEEIIIDLKHNFPTLDCNYSLILLGAAIHDAGKIIFPNEIYSSGNRHELEGERYLINLDIPSHIAKFSRTHAYWNNPENTIKDLIVALADVLWKGCRNKNLEHLVIKKIAISIKKDFWGIFITTDSLFEKISDGGIDRLNRSL